MAASNGESLIKLESVQKVFYTDEVETHALEDVHLQINTGDYIAIAGPSGCGKTTLLSILGLLDTPTGGSYQRPGRAGAKTPRSDRAPGPNPPDRFISPACQPDRRPTAAENA